MFKEFFRQQKRKQAVLAGVLKRLKKDRDNFHEAEDGVVYYNKEEYSAIAIVCKLFTCRVDFGYKTYKFGPLSGYLQILDNLYFSPDPIGDVNRFTWSGSNNFPFSF